MKFKKARKPRGRKKNGHMSYDLCSGCYYPHCDPMFRRPGHIDERLEKGLCPGCGKDPCTCKSSLSVGFRKGEDPNKLTDVERMKVIRKNNRLFYNKAKKEYIEFLKSRSDKK